MNAAREGQGGLIALSVEEAHRLLEWHEDHRAALSQWPASESKICVDLAARIEEWVARHVPAGAVDDD